ncbi:hypothetical protein [Roseovarius sp. E0-M6]|uniref:hypothetical protein n=1 Tax=Roseovarius sp. E0-M6 TaxID=3127118 RepID=UPI0030105B28
MRGNPPAKVHDGWGKSKRKITNAGECKTEMARIYRRTAAGEMDAEDMKAAIWALRQMAEIAERAELEAKIARLEQKLSEVERGR